MGKAVMHTASGLACCVLGCQQVHVACSFALLSDACWRLLPQPHPTSCVACCLTAEPSDDAIKRTLDYLHDRAKGATYFTASDPGRKQKGLPF